MILLTWQAGIQSTCILSKTVNMKRIWNHALTFRTSFGLSASLLYLIWWSEDLAMIMKISRWYRIAFIFYLKGGWNKAEVIAMENGVWFWRRNLEPDLPLDAKCVSSICGGKLCPLPMFWGQGCFIHSQNTGNFIFFLAAVVSSVQLTSILA